MLSQPQLQNICLLLVGDHRQCRYLQEDTLTWQWFCVKQKKLTKGRIDKNLNAFFEECNEKGLDHKSQGIPLGDNCRGYPIFKNIVQGYDQLP